MSFVSKVRKFFSKVKEFFVNLSWDFSLKGLGFVVGVFMLLVIAVASGMLFTALISLALIWYCYDAGLELVENFVGTVRDKFKKDSQPDSNTANTVTDDNT